MEFDYLLITIFHKLALGKEYLNLDPENLPDYSNPAMDEYTAYYYTAMHTNFNLNSGHRDSEFGNRPFMNIEALGSKTIINAYKSQLQDLLKKYLLRLQHNLERKFTTIFMLIYKKIMKQLSFLLIIFSASGTFAQEVRLGDSLEVSFLTFNNEVVDSSHFNLGIKVKNILEKPTSVYQELDLGYPQERFANSYVLLEKKVSGKYVRQPTVFHRISDEALTNKAYWHFDPPKRILAAHGEDTLWLSLRKLMLQYDTGAYRMKIYLRTNTIWNIPPNSDSSAYYFPTRYKIKYISGDWKHFRVERQLKFVP